MFGFYQDGWTTLPISWRIGISILSVLVLGYSVSPVSLASSLVFSIDQNLGCQHQVSIQASLISSGLNKGDKALKNWEDCQQKIPAHPNLIDQYHARQQGRTIMFSKEAK